MELDKLIAGLSRAEAFPDRESAIEVRQTHISVVFLGAKTVFKIKKPVNLGFLDFSTLEQRHRFCLEEDRLNRRLASEEYQGVVPVTESPGGLRFGGDGPVVEWAVRMRRLPESATWSQRLKRGEIGRGEVQNLAKRLAAFHRTAERGPRVTEFGRFAVVAANARENFVQTASHVGKTVTAGVHGRAQQLTEQWLHRKQDLIEARAERGVPCDTHGDLRLDHIYGFPERTPPDDLVIIDCIEFSDRFRFADPAADVAFVVMDLVFHGRRDLAAALSEEYFRAAGDADGRNLLPLYLSYRAAVRAKVNGMKSQEREVPAEQRQLAALSAKAHWLLSLAALQEPNERPCLILIGGLPGVGKSTLARALAERAGFELLRSDVVRKELVAAERLNHSANQSVDNIYSAKWTERTYVECARRAVTLLEDGARVIVDASFVDDAHRVNFINRAKLLCIPAAFIVCEADPHLVAKRLKTRRGDASDADQAVHQKLAARWQSPSPPVQAVTHVVCTDDAARAVESAQRVLALLDCV